MSEVAVVTGGASGFGRALGACFAERGLRVVLLDIDGARAEQEADAIAAAQGTEVVGRHVDVADAGSVDAAAQAVAERFGRADVVVANVGVQLFGAVESLTDDEWRWVLDVNVVGSVRTARSFLPLLRRAERPRLAFTSSSGALAPAARLGAYQASKFALWGVAETLRLELTSDGVTVSVVFPSGMVTRHLETSEAVQPDPLRRPVARPDDLDAMMASNPAMATAIAMPEDAAANVVDALLAGERYVVTHGDLVADVTSRADALRTAAEAARDR